MKPIFVLPLAILLSVGASLAVVKLAQRDVKATPSPAITSADLAQLADSIAGLRKQHETLAHDVDGLRNDVAAVPRGESRVPLGDIDSAVARALEKHAASELASTAAASSSTMPAAQTKKKFDAHAAYAKLLGEGLSWEDKQKMWKEIGDAGELDAVLALFEQRAKDHPNDPVAQVDLGHAYLQKIYKAGAGPEAGVWATKADKSFDAALALDDHNWDARFSKAMSLSFWPPVFGKQGEAINQFETLVSQQEQTSAQPQFAQTYLLLGNMYQQSGDKAKALAAWQKGLGFFPDNPQLQQQIANAH